MTKLIDDHVTSKAAVAQMRKRVKKAGVEDSFIHYTNDEGFKQSDQEVVDEGSSKKARGSATDLAQNKNDVSNDLFVVAAALYDVVELV